MHLPFLVKSQHLKIFADKVKICKIFIESWAALVFPIELYGKNHENFLAEMYML